MPLAPRPPKRPPRPTPPTKTPIRDFLSGRSAARKEKDRLQPPRNVTGPRG